jgi:hypothetical protein
MTKKFNLLFVFSAVIVFICIGNEVENAENPGKSLVNAYSRATDHSNHSSSRLHSRRHSHNKEIVKPLFDVKRFFPVSLQLTNPQLFGELQNYINYHHRDVVLADPDFCNRSYVVATYACPQQIGNHFHEFLNGFLGSFLTNRTLLWAFCERKPCKVDNLNDCDEVMTRHNWMLSHNDFVTQYNTKNCGWKGGSNPFELVTMGFRAFTEEFIMCCGIDLLDTILPIINFGNHELHQFSSLSLPNARLRPHSKYLAKLLFRHGEDYAYGVLLRSSFQIKSFIIERNNELIANHLKTYYKHQLQQNEKQEGKENYESEIEPFYISVHLRHATNTDTKDLQDNNGYDCLHKILPKFYSVLQMIPPHSNETPTSDASSSTSSLVVSSNSSTAKRPCVILLASDRSQTLEYWSTHKVINNKINCTVIKTNHSKSHTEWTEHGPFTGEIAVSDIDLLSRGDIVLGSSYLMTKLQNMVSSFSLLISELRATNGREYSASFRSRFLPECEEAIAAARTPKALFKDHKLDCKKIIEWPVGLHDACPYANQTFESLK